jgi:phenylalanyl-tRNA synthetase beta chain
VPGRSAEIVVDGRKVGSLGQVHPDVASYFDIDHEAYLFELHLDDLVPLNEEIRHHEPVSRFPPVVQDIALVVDDGVGADAVRAIIDSHDLVRTARVFDVYEGEGIPTGKKSLAFSVTYQASDRTLSDQEVAKAQKAILGRLKNELGAELR